MALNGVGSRRFHTGRIGMKRFRMLLELPRKPHLSLSKSPKLGERIDRRALKRKLRKIEREARRVKENVPSVLTHMDDPREIPSLLRACTRRIELLESQVPFLGKIMNSASLEELAVNLIDALLKNNRRVEARSLGYSLTASKGDYQIGRLCLAKIAYHEQIFDHAWELLREVDYSKIFRHMLFEYSDLHTKFEGETSLLQVPNWSAHLISSLSDADLIRLEELVIARNCPGLERAIFVVLQNRGVQLDSFLQRTRTHFLARQSCSTPLPGAIGPSQDDRVRIALLEYKGATARETSCNLGDYVQSLALIGNLCRFQSVWGGNDEELISFCRTIQAGIARDRTISTPAEVEIGVISRDFASGHQARPKTWSIIFGWHMHSALGDGYDFPYPEWIQPIFISFHLNKPGILTREAVDYLKLYQPIGCRDWSTVYLLRDHGIEAFFSGCLTLTINEVFGNELVERVRWFADVAHVDLPRRGVSHVKHMREHIRGAGFAANLREAYEQLRSYRRCKRIVTSRLHCALPCLAMGLPVEFEPRREADVRLDGLQNLTFSDAQALARRISAQLEAVFRKILSGASTEEVYAVWREITASEVAAAHHHCSVDGPWLDPPFNICEAIARVQTESFALHAGQSTPSEARRLDLAFGIDQNFVDYFPVTLSSVVFNSASPLSVHILCRNVAREYFEWVASLFPDTAFRIYPFDHIDYGGNVRTLAHISIATMDRLLLPELLDQVKKVLYLDVDIVALGDVSELFELDLGLSPVAARESIHPRWATGYDLVYRPSMRLSADRAFEFRRRMHALHPLSSKCFNAGVVLMNLTRMRQDQFCRRFIGFADRYGLNDQEILNCYVGDNFVRLDKRWNSFPSQEVPHNPKIVHWVGPIKPWSHGYVLHQELWQDYSRRCISLAEGDPLKGHAEVI